MDKFGTMRHGVELLGTSRKLHAGQRVELQKPTNLPDSPDSVQWYASPLNGAWGDDSMLIDNADVALDDNGTARRVPDRKPGIAYLADMEFGGE